MDLTRGSSHDHVDNPFWSVFQIKVKSLTSSGPSETLTAVGDADIGKVLLFVNLTCEQKQQAETKKELEKLRLLTQRYGKDGFGVYGAFTYDVLGGDDFNNRDIANTLTQWGFLTQDSINENMRFIAKLDVNGKEMHNLYKFLKRGSPLFVHRYGRSRRITEYYDKFLTNRYGEVKHYYGPRTEYAVIEADIKKLLEEQFIPKKYEQLLEPKSSFGEI